MRYDDSPDNQVIVGQTVRVTTQPSPDSPYWMDVTFEGQVYSVRGGDCTRVSQVVAGIDEVGRGALAGNLVVVAAAFRLPGPWEVHPCPIPDVKDSKAYKATSKLTVEERREAAAQAILNWPGLRGAGAGVVTPEEINAHGMSWAMQEAIQRAVAGIQVEGRRLRPDLILLDGNERVPNWSGAQRATPKADALWWPVSAASVLAKVYRDREMIAMDKVYPGYGFGKHKGYGTEHHIKALQTKGPTPIHRTTFIRSALGE